MNKNKIISSISTTTILAIPMRKNGQSLRRPRPTSSSSISISITKITISNRWNHVEILLVGGANGGQLKLKPSGIRKGKKLCIKVPPNLESRDYDVRVVFAGKILHGAIPLAVRGDSDNESDSEQ